MLIMFDYFSDEGVTETFECVEPIVGRYVSIVRTGVEDVLSLCEVEVFSTSGLSAQASCQAADLEAARVSVFDGSCFHFIKQEVSGFDEAVEKCESESANLLDDLTNSSTEFVTNKIESLHKDESTKSHMVWVGAQRERTSNFRGEVWKWKSSDEQVKP